MTKLAYLLLLTPLLLAGCGAEAPCGSTSGKILDEAKCVGRDADSLKAADDDYFADMDYGLSHNPAEVQARLEPFIPGITEDEALKAFVRGRNNWIVWTAGNDTLWDELSRVSVGNLDLLKTVSNHPSLGYSRDNRWQYLGVVNEPCYTKGDKPRADRFGLYLDNRDPACGADPFEDEAKYPGIAIGARGKTVPLGSYYGYGTGIVGLRLFPNPDFDEDAKANWDPERYYNDPSYYNDKKLVKPYRVGMSCGFCHVGPNPTNPPADPEHPSWANLNSNPGAQYFWVDRIFMWKQDPSNFPFQLFHTSRPGALDTSLVSSDYINNPRTMNAIYNLPARVALAGKLGKEKLAGGSKNNKQFNQVPEVPSDSALNNFYQAPDTVLTPRVLKDGADSVGALGALNRVFVNIGLFSDEWFTHFRPLIGGKRITPFEIEVARKNSSFWNANEAQTPDLALFFLASAQPDYLAQAPGGERYLSQDSDQLQQGKTVFAENCARCHSSKLPDEAWAFFPNEGCVNGNYLKCWNDYWQWTKTDQAKAELRDIVLADDFLKDNFLSTELRVPVTLLETNACSPLATNAIEDNIWDNFSSESYKKLPAVGTIQVQNPYTGQLSDYKLPGGGRGYTRPASLVSMWSSAPFLLNNSLGDFYWTGSVQDRMASFDDSIEKLLWPEKREGDFEVITRSGKRHPGQIDRTTSTSYLRVSSGYLPDFLSDLQGPLARWLPWLFGDDGVQIGPIPKGTPVNLISNIDMEERGKVLKLLVKLKHDLKALPPGASDEQAKEVFSGLLKPLLDVNKCPDFVVNKGHYFGTGYLEGEPGLSDEDKRALIAFLKTF
ncbi:c-type cytochrome [Gallaecimonas xiamenensis]|uniref:Cytochrome c domain-containing protein n=1 Tax=Gallaecimonas xiamenensis 3-C-1 TaxID=745411 RepID=K2JF15_9GAMM|nr:hypothetical protein [Gallaecimonas xiamenensis]EKE73658.1 hypothetical protein B3C1_09682 [Gallaecimonas xiamenensis 3-C-1]